MTRLQRVITSARGKKLSVKRANIEAWKGTRTVSFYTDNKERARLRNATKRPRGVSSITSKSSVDFSSRRRKIGAFLFSIYFFEISYRILLDGWTHFFDHVPRPITREGVDARGSLHVSRICIESRHNEADYRKIVHEYLESGGEGGMVGFHTERVSKYRRDADRFRDDERKREAMNGTIFEFGRQRAANSRIIKKGSNGEIGTVLSLFLIVLWPVIRIVQRSNSG